MQWILIFILSAFFLLNVCAMWLLEVTTQNTFMISSDKILTLVEPNSKLVRKYEDVISE